MADQTDTSWAILWDRLHNAADWFDTLRKQETDFTEKNRIDAHASGVRRAISYMADMGGRDAT